MSYKREHVIPINLGECLLSASARFLINSGSGVQIELSNGDDDIIYANVDLHSEDYKGENLKLLFHYSLFGVTPGAGDDVHWDVKYFLFNADDSSDPESTSTSFTEEMSVDGQSLNESYDFLFTNEITGVVGATHIQLTIERNSTGAGQDAYGGDVELLNMCLMKQ